MSHRENKIKAEQTLPLREPVVRKLTDAMEQRIELLQSEGLQFTPAELAHACMLIVFEAGALVQEGIRK